MSASATQRRLRLAPRLLGAAALVAALGMALPAGADAATTFVANKLGDHAPGSCTRSDCTLREAVIAANANPGPDRILLRPGKTYELSRTGIDDDSVAGDLDIRDPLLIRSAGPERARIDANGVDRVLHVPESGATTRLRLVIVTGGDGGSGGGILAESRLGLVGSAVLRNRSTRVGGIDAAAGMVLAASRVAGNRGGGLDLGGPTRIDRSLIAANVDERNGGVDADSLGGSEPLVIRRSVIARNRATDLGFAEGAGVNAYARLRLIRSRVIGNEAGGEGGGVHSRGERTVIRSSTIAGNTAAQRGGGVSIGNAAAPAGVVIAHSTFSGNRTLGDGGGISFVVEAGSRMRAVNSTVARNRAADNGGGIEMRGGEVALNALTVARNLGDADAAGSHAGGGLYQDLAFLTPADVTVDNSLIALNRIGAGGLGPDCAGSYTSGRRNLISDDEGCADLAGPGDLVRSNPRIGRLGRHGGPTATVPLRRASPAIDRAGRDAPRRDQRGVRRGRRPDIGAFER